MQKDLTKGNILTNLIYFSLPYLLSCFLQTFYGLADLFIAGQYNGSDTITAIATGSQIMHMVTLIIVGIAVGSTVMISQSVGSGDTQTCSKVIGNTITVFLIFSIALTALLLFFTSGIVAVMDVPSDAVKEAKQYLMICFIGVPFITAYNIISCIFRGLGDSKTPMFFIAVACVANLGLDMFFIGHCALGAMGAALGTVLSQTISVVIALITIRKRNTGLVISREDLRPERKIAKSIFKVGTPIAVQDICIQVSFILITIIANGRGSTIAASVGIVEKIIGFLFLIPSAMMSSVSAISAQNVGAGAHKRARRTLFYGVTITFTCGMIFSVICQFIAPDLVLLFTDDATVAKLGGGYLRSYAFDCAVAGIHFCFSGFFCAYGKSIISFLHNIISIVLVRIPGAYLASTLYPATLFPMGLAAPLGSLLSALICVGIYISMRRRGKLS